MIELPCSAAKCKGVFPCWSFWLTFAPFLIRHSATFSRPRDEKHPCTRYIHTQNTISYQKQQLDVTVFFHSHLQDWRFHHFEVACPQFCQNLLFYVNNYEFDFKNVNDSANIRYLCMLPDAMLSHPRNQPCWH